MAWPMLYTSLIDGPESAYEYNAMEPIFYSATRNTRGQLINPLSLDKKRISITGHAKSLEPKPTFAPLTSALIPLGTLKRRRRKHVIRVPRVLQPVLTPAQIDSVKPALQPHSMSESRRHKEAAKSRERFASLIVFKYPQIAAEVQQEKEAGARRSKSLDRLQFEKCSQIRIGRKLAFKRNALRKSEQILKAIQNDDLLVFGLATKTVM